MKTHYLTPKLVDIFLNMNTFPTGYEESCWLRLQQREKQWLQIKGIKVPPWKFKMITENLNHENKKSQSTLKK
jgi:type II secretory ATPase GspE/PulE/Tfp pilus assembly ATPase PilB-like protein